ncbi:MAG: MFS transporter, partial [Alphaproteobacteria bacterium]|nr:MFS transporter [Alphaproteobacteria bacterium]
MITPTKSTSWYFLPLVVLVAGCCVAIINFGVRSTFGQFTLPISTEYGWPRETFSLALALQNLLWGIATPFAGALADRYGSARVLMTGAIIYALGVAGMAYAGTPILFHFTAGIMVGTGIALSSFGIVMAALGRIVPPEKRSWAFGLATASGSLGQFIFSPTTGGLLAAYSWQTVLLILAASALLIIPLAAPLLVQNSSGSKAGAGETELSMSQAIKKAFGHNSYLLLVSGFFVCGFQLAFVTVHLPPYLSEHGITKEFAGLAMGLIGLFNVIGSYTAGVIGARDDKRFPLAAIYLLRAVAIVAFISLPITQTTTLIFTATLGFLWLSTVPFTMQLVIVMFGTRYMATLY